MRFVAALVLASGIAVWTLLAPPTAGAQNIFGCYGDCDQTGAVEVVELLACVRGALFGRDASGIGSCFDVCDANGDGVIQVNELILAVNHAINGCPPDPPR